MNKVALIAALGMGCVGFLLLEHHKSRFEAEMSGGAPVAILAVAQDVPLGQAVTRDMLVSRALPEAYVEERHIRTADIRKVLGVRTSQVLRANESLLWSDLASTEGRRNLSAMVQSGKRAFTVRSEDGTLPHLVRPGDRVDLLMTAEKDGETVTYPLLQNLLVLAVGVDLGDGADQGVRGRSSRTRDAVTVALSLAQAQLVTVAAKSGRVTPVLRNPDDIAVHDGVAETRAADVLKSERLSEIQNPPRVFRTDKGIERVR